MHTISGGPGSTIHLGVYDGGLRWSERVSWVSREGNECELNGMVGAGLRAAACGWSGLEDSTMVMMHNKTPRFVVPGEIDLSAGAELNTVTGEVIRHIACWAPKKPKKSDEPEIDYWKRREQELSRELFLASELDPTMGLSLFDTVLVWPGWLEKPVFFRDLRGYFNVAASIIRRALRPYGWEVELNGETRWALRTPEDWTGAVCPISAALAIGPFKNALAAFRENDHGAALSNARSALDLSKGSHGAKLIIAASIFQFGERVETEFATEMAKYILKYEENLRSAITTISVLWKREQERRPQDWAHTVGYVRWYEDQLMDYAETFEGARRFLYGNDHDLDK